MPTGPQPRRTPWRHRRLTRREELASVWLLVLAPALAVALLAPLSRCSPPGAAAGTTAPAAPVAGAEDPIARWPSWGTVPQRSIAVTSGEVWPGDRLGRSSGTPAEMATRPRN